MTKFLQSRLEKDQKLEDWIQKKIIEPKDLVKKVEAIKKENKTIATLNGSFDLMHAGHLYIIFEAAKQADILIVALNSDSSIKKYKSENRPIIGLKNRIDMMASLSFVDFVTYFDETDPIDLILKVRPHVHVNGAEYGSECIEKKAVDEVGARLHIVDRIPGLATSEIIKKIQSL
jgi:rfaE bifunctional protein nucleotidyltransferase chain/domain